MKTLSRWMGANEDLIKEMIFEALKTESSVYQQAESQPKVVFSDKELPEAAMPIAEWVNSSYLPDISQDIEPVINYVYSRGMDPLSEDFYWSPANGYIDRLIIPFRWQGRIVGNTARKIKEGRPKYLSNQHPNFVFNFDRQIDSQKYLFVCEGPFDALSLNGVALLTNEISDQQARIINSIGSEVIVIPDQDLAGMTLIDRAMELDWSVAFPNWEPDIKDAAEAVNRYGSLFVTIDAIKTAQKGSIKITMAKKNLQNKLERILDEKNI